MSRMVLSLEPDGWFCPIAHCPPGPFVYDRQLCFMSEYKDKGEFVAYNSAGEYFVIKDVNVQPVKASWLEVEE